MVSGHEGVKARLRRAAQAILAGRLRGVPMGYLIAGPVGSAKTFLVNCFTGEIGFPCVKFLNFRSQWQGVTEGNLEKILKLLHAMWPVGVIIDEADAFLGDRNQQGDSGTSNRVFAQLASFMGEHRVPRQDRLVPDHVPARSAAGRPEAPGPRRGAPRALLPADAARSTTRSSASCSNKSGVHSRRHVDHRGDRRSRRACRAPTSRPSWRGRCSSPTSTSDGQTGGVGRRCCAHAFADFIPATSPLERELQILAAVQECTSREVLPEIYRDRWIANAVLARG